jgi:hypothetical protein
MRIGGSEWRQHRFEKWVVLLPASSIEESGSYNRPDKFGSLIIHVSPDCWTPVDRYARTPTRWASNGRRFSRMWRFVDSESCTAVHRPPIHRVSLGDWNTVFKLFKAFRSSSGRATISIGLVVVGLILAIIGSLIEDWMAAEVATHSFFIMVVLLVSVATMISAQIVIYASLESLKSSHRLRMEYHSAMSTEESIALHDLLARVVRQVPDGAEIMAVNSYVEVFADNEIPALVAAQRAYLRELKAKFDTNPYHRLVQLKNGESARPDGRLSTQLARAYLEHYRDMVRHRQVNRRRSVKLEEVQAKFPTSFIVFRHGEGGQIIWQMHEHAPSSSNPDRMALAGAFLITDPDGELVRHLVEWFRILDDEGPRPLTEADLDDPPTPQSRAA